MKMINLHINQIVIIITFIVTINISLFNSNYINLKKDSKIGEITLLEKIYSNELYETWKVGVFEKKVNNVYFSHIFKYPINQESSFKPSHIDDFCSKITKVNNNLESSKTMIRVMTCKDKIKQTTNINGVISYLLFNQLEDSFTLKEICQSKVTKENIYRRNLKELTLSLLRLVEINLSSQTWNDIYFQLGSSKSFFYGKLPIDKSKGKPSTTNYFITIPFLPIFNHNEIENFKIFESKVKEIQMKIDLVKLSDLLINLYNGRNILNRHQEITALEDTLKITTTSNQISEIDTIEIYKQFNKHLVSEGLNQEDPYFGIDGNTSTYIKDIITKKVKSDEIDLSKLKGSFYEFLKKLGDFSSQQFTSLKEAMTHPFIINPIDLKFTRSDTSIYLNKDEIKKISQKDLKESINKENTKKPIEKNKKFKTKR